MLGRATLDHAPGIDPTHRGRGQGSGTPHSGAEEAALTIVGYAGSLDLLFEALPRAR